jgi:hypothetical protein
VLGVLNMAADGRCKVRFAAPPGSPRGGPSPHPRPADAWVPREAVAAEQVENYRRKVRARDERSLVAGGMGLEAAVKAVAAVEEIKWRKIIHSERAGAANAAPEAEGGFSLGGFGPPEREGGSGSESEGAAEDIITCDHCGDDCTAESFNFFCGDSFVEMDLCPDCFDPHHCNLLEIMKAGKASEACLKNAKRCAGGEPVAATCVARGVGCGDDATGIVRDRGCHWQCPVGARPGRSSAHSVFPSKSVSHGALVWTRRVLNIQKTAVSGPGRRDAAAITRSGAPCG